MGYNWQKNSQRKPPLAGVQPVKPIMAAMANFVTMTPEQRAKKDAARLAASTAKETTRLASNAEMQKGVAAKNATALTAKNSGYAAQNATLAAQSADKKAAATAKYNQILADQKAAIPSVAMPAGQTSIGPGYNSNPSLRDPTGVDPNFVDPTETEFVDPTETEGSGAKPIPFNSIVDLPILINNSSLNGQNSWLVTWNANLQRELASGAIDINEYQTSMQGMFDWIKANANGTNVTGLAP
jgi:hypothetical protein